MYLKNEHRYFSLATSFTVLFVAAFEITFGSGSPPYLVHNATTLSIMGH